MLETILIDLTELFFAMACFYVICRFILVIMEAINDLFL